MSSQPIKIRVCELCRVRHYKCDDRSPVCQRCVRAGKRCVRDRGIRFHLDELRKPAVFPRGQNWVPYPNRVDFVDETELVAQGFEWKDDCDLIPPPNRGNMREEASCDESQTPHGDDLSLSEIQTTPLSLAATSPPSAPTTTLPTSTGFTSRYSLLLASSVSVLAHRTPLNQASWPLLDQQEATLFGHFVTDVSKFFDFCDRDRHFAVEVPQRARKCPTLYNAILALSARHLSQISDFDPYASNHYYQECLKTLIPALSDPDAALDDNLLVATVVLRLLEEFDVPEVGSDAQGHLIGTQLFLQAQALNPMEQGLKQAAYWAGVRQDIYISLTFQRAPNIKPRTRLFLAEESPLGATNDCTWACRAILHCADVLGFAFGTHEDSRSPALYQRLEDYNREWRHLRPSSFDPYFSQVRADNTFPDLRFHTDWHVMGHQYIELAYILLLVYDPLIPRVGPTYRSTVLLLDERVRNITRTLCGTGLSHPSTPSAILIACMAIDLCGDRFTEPGEQEELLSILIETERLHGWPTKRIQQSLRNTRV